MRSTLHRMGFLSAPFSKETRDPGDVHAIVHKVPNNLTIIKSSGLPSIASVAGQLQQSTKERVLLKGRWAN